MGNIFCPQSTNAGAGQLLVVLRINQQYVGSDISSKTVSDNIRTVGKTTREPHKMSYLNAAKKSME